MDHNNKQPQIINDIDDPRTSTQLWHNLHIHQAQLQLHIHQALLHIHQHTNYHQQLPFRSLK
jgi:hypothetical protein